MAENAVVQEGIIIATCNSRTDATIHFLDELPSGVVINVDGWEHWGQPMRFGAVWKIEESPSRWEILGVFNFQDAAAARRVRLFCQEMQRCGAEDLSDKASCRIEEEARTLGPCGDQLHLLATYAVRIGRLRPNGITC